MAVNSGPQISRTGLVSHYDASNEKSFRGLNTTNLMYGAIYRNLGDTAFYKSSSGTESVFIPYFNQLVNVTYVDIYNDYNASIAQYGSQYCCPNPFQFFSTNIAVTGSTTYMYQLIFKTDTGYYNANYMYRYEFNSGGTTLIEGGLVDSSRLESLGDGWYHAWGSFTTNANTTQMTAWLFHYEYATWNRIRVAAVCLTQGSVVHRPEHILNLGYRTARGTTVATGGGLKDLVGSNDAELLNGVSFASGGGGSLVFDGVNDYVSVPSFGLALGNTDFTLEFWLLVSASSANFGIFLFGSGPFNTNSKGCEVRFQTNTLEYGINDSSGVANRLQYTFTNIADSVWRHFVITQVKQGTATLYVNGTSVATQTYSNESLYTDLFGISIGRGNDGYLNGRLGQFKIYDRALTTAEVLTNYNSSRSKIAATTNRNIILSRTNVNALSTTSLFTSIILYIDGANRQSYIPSSQFIYDLSPNKRKFTMYTNGGSTYYLTAYGSISLSTEGKGSLQFDGTNDWIHLNENITAPSTVTISVWVKISVSGLKGIISHCSGGPVNLGYSIDTKMTYVYYSGQWNTETGYANINDGYWKMVTWVKNATNMKLYVNGVLDKEITLVADVTGPLRAIGTSWGPCSSNNGIMGVLAYGPGSDSYGTVFNGLMGPFMIWSRSLTAADVTQLWNNFRLRYNLNNIVTSGLVLHLSGFDRTSYPASGTTWTDLSGNGYTGTLTNGPTFNSTGGGSIVFDGVDDYVNLPASSTIISLPINAISLECWAKTINNTTNGYIAFVSINSFSSTLCNLWFSNTGEVNLSFASGRIYSLKSPNFYNDGQWHHIIGIFSTINGIKLYVDTVLVATNTRNLTNSIGSGSTVLGNNALLNQPFNGSISMFRIYNIELSETQISQNFNVDRWRFGV